MKWCLTEVLSWCRDLGYHWFTSGTTVMADIDDAAVPAKRLGSACDPPQRKVIDNSLPELFKYMRIQYMDGQFYCKITVNLATPYCNTCVELNYHNILC